MLSEKQKNIEIYKATYTAELNIPKLAELAGLTEYQNFYNEHKRNSTDGIISLTAIKDLLLRRRIVEFLISNFNIMGCSAFHTYRVLALLEIMSEFKAEIELEYTAFVEICKELAEKAMHRKGGVRSFLHMFYCFCEEKDHEDNPLEADIWKLEWFNISLDRDYAKRYDHFFFYNIKNQRNKELIKHYIEYCLKNTGLSIQTIYGRLSSLQTVLNLIEKPYDEWDCNDARALVEKIKERYSERNTIGSRMAVLFQFNDYLLLHDYIIENPIRELRDLSRMGTFKYKTTAADHSVILQIFNALDLIEDERVVLCFLMIYCVGMRVVEACSIGYDCIEKRGEETFLKYYSLKMKKDVCNVIPRSLYERIKRYKSLSKSYDFLFPAKRSRNHRAEKPMSSSYFYSEINKAMKIGGVINPDGTQYRFSPHSFRHLIAVKMREHKIPIQFIQEQLHHKSLEMTMQYLEYIDRAKIKKMDEFIDVHGEKVGIETKFIFDEDIDYANYMRKILRAQMLPNGICSRPIRLGRCPHGNACLTCPDFRTSKENLNTHKQQLKEVESLIKQAKENGWLPQVETNEIIRRNLLSIIEKLEEMTTSEQCCTSNCTIYR